MISHYSESTDEEAEHSLSTTLGPSLGTFKASILEHQMTVVLPCMIGEVEARLAKRISKYLMGGKDVYANQFCIRQ